MYWRMHFFKAWDHGKIAVSMSDDEVVMERQLRLALQSKEALLIDGSKWVPQSYILRKAKQVAPFKQADIAGRSTGRSGSTQMIHQTLDRMERAAHVLRMRGDQLKLSTKEILVTLSRDRL
jgi:hypothetical protein